MLWRFFLLKLLKSVRPVDEAFPEQRVFGGAVFVVFWFNQDSLT